MEINLSTNNREYVLNRISNSNNKSQAQQNPDWEFSKSTIKNIYNVIHASLFAMHQY